MSGERSDSEAQGSQEALLVTVETLNRRVEALKQEKHDLELMLEMATEHADHVSESLVEERDDLATMLEMTTEHGDTVEDELHERAEAALRKSAEQLRAIIEATPAPVLISRLDDSEILYANVMTGTLFNVPAESLLRRKTLDLYFDPADRHALIRTLQQDNSVDRQEIRFKRPDGTMIWVELSLRSLEFNSQPSILSSLHDITQRKQAEQRLQLQVEELRQELEETSLSSEQARSTGTSRFKNLDAVVIEQDSTQVIGVHSFRGGNGKSSITANLAGQLAAAGHRVGVLDADIQSPGIHVLLGQAGKDIEYTLNDFLLGNCGVHQLPIDVSEQLGQTVSGQVFLIPASVSPGAMAQVLSQGYEAQRLTHCLADLSKLLQLDVLLVDTHPGLNEEALLIMRAVQSLIIVLRPDAQDFEGTGVSVQVARQLEVPNIQLMVNQLPDSRDRQTVRVRVEKTFDCEVAAILPQSAEFLTFDEAGLFVLQHPRHPISVALEHLATRFIGVTA